ncbi:hypothetical protein Tco_0168810 [Tanacetum coccineum]
MKINTLQLVWTKEKKRSRKGKDSEPPKKSSKSKESSNGKTPPKTSKTAKSVTAEESKDNSIWFKQPPRRETLDPKWKKDSNIDEGQEQTCIVSRNIKITKADLEGPVFQLLKGTCRSSITLEYHLEQHYLAFFDKLDWANRERDKCPFDLSKPLPLQGHPGHLTIPVNFFFNNDLEYLKTGNTKRKYITLISKTRATRNFSLETQASVILQIQINRKSRHEVHSTMKILSVIRVKVDKQFGYGYLEEIVVRRADQKEYKEGDFPSLHLDDIEDMLLLHVQNKLFHLPGDDIVNFVIALRMFTRSIVIQKKGRRFTT